MAIKDLFFNGLKTPKYLLTRGLDSRSRHGHKSAMLFFKRRFRRV